VLYGALTAMGQKDMKRLVSYTSVSHFGFIGLGCFAFTSQAQTGAVLYMVNHGLSTGALFLVIGFLIARGKSRLVGDYSGVAMVAPLLAGSFFIAGLSALALPGLSTFVSEFLVLLGTFPTYPVAAVLATLGIILAAIYVLLVYQRTMQGPLRLPEASSRRRAGSPSATRTASSARTRARSPRAAVAAAGSAPTCTTARATCSTPTRAAPPAPRRTSRSAGAWPWPRRPARAGRCRP
jgi:NADH-quinone oxidoreductase subunit M